MTAIEIIKRSIDMHPSMFVEQLEARHKTDASYGAARAEDSAIRRSVLASMQATERAIVFVKDENPEAFTGDMSAGIIALNVACKLQCLPSHVRTAAAVETWES